MNGRIRFDCRVSLDTFQVSLFGSVSIAACHFWRLIFGFDLPYNEASFLSLLKSSPDVVVGIGGFFMPDFLQHPLLNLREKRKCPALVANHPHFEAQG